METDAPGLEVYQLRIALREISPAIWRRVLVRSDSTIADLHYTLQIVMGWSDFHLHRFVIHGKEYGVIGAGTDVGHVVLDPFCGCGTTIAAAHKLEREWIGIDITHLAIGLIKHRLRDAYGDDVEDSYTVTGEPTTLDGARQLAEEDKHQFEWWALGLVGARPAEQRKGADRGIDGRILFHDEGVGGRTKQLVISVKGGNVTVSQLRDLRGVVDREDAAIGVLISMEKPTKAMRTEAATAGFYDSPWGKHPRLQLLTVEELLDGKKIDGPPSRQTARTFKRAPRATQKAAENLELFGQPDDAPPPKPRKRQKKSN